MVSTSQVLLISAIPVGAAFMGALIAAIRPPGRIVRSSIRHFAAGVIFSVVAVDLLPEVRRGHDPFEVGWTFAAGLALMLAIDELVKRFNHGGQHAASGGPSPGQLIPIGVDLVTEELLIEAHESADTAITTTMFFVGFLIFLLLGMIE
jgi:zinc transporter, ZIP family